MPARTECAMQSPGQAVARVCKYLEPSLQALDLGEPASSALRIRREADGTVPQPASGALDGPPRIGGLR